jgi:hypothetical protein
MSSSPRYFTLEQANAVVNAIRPILAEIQEIRQAILARQPRIWPVVAKAAGNGGNKDASLAVVEFQRLDSLVRTIQGTGAILKDIDSGLVDFPALRQGREIYLCWRFGEDEIEFWHDIDTGLAGRQPLD